MREPQDEQNRDNDKKRTARRFLGDGPMMAIPPLLRQTVLALYAARLGGPGLGGFIRFFHTFHLIRFYLEAPAPESGVNVSVLYLYGLISSIATGFFFFFRGGA